MKFLVILVFLLFVPFLFAGFVNRTKAFWAGRRGASVLQPLFDAVKLLRKSAVFGSETTVLFQFASPLSLAATLVAGLMIPFAAAGSVISFTGDLVVFVGLLGLSRFLLTVSAMDTGSSFEGMGASREAFFSSLAEPAIFLLFGVMVLMSGGISFNAFPPDSLPRDPLHILVLLLTAVALFILILTEGGRVPVDDPATHLELTMIHEVMLLDHSGPDLAMQTYAHSLRTSLLAVLFCDLLIPASAGTAVSLGLLAAGLVLTAFLVGCVESFVARLRLSHVPQLLLFTGALSFLIYLALLTTR